MNKRTTNKSNTSKFSFKKLNHWPLLAIFLLPLSVSAVEEEEAPGMSEMWEVEVAAKDTEAFEKAFKDHMKVRAKKGDPRAWQVYTPHTGDEMDRYLIRHCCFKWADRDAYAKWSQDSEIGKDWNSGPGKYAKSYSHHYSWVDHENSNWPNDGKSYAMVGVTTYKIKPGSNANESVKEISKLAKDMGWDKSWAWSFSASGPSSVRLVFPFENFADMSPSSPSFAEKAAKHLGSKEKAEAVFDRFSSNFKGTSYAIFTHRGDLSSKMDK
ncbi:hypothetical protein [Kangiella sp. TOML190]|uniref:hypothetical protein n=1 Tax=Kangiella sp. TOML190 TaxID=2931351 RepID=UPI00204125C1|nr:hypothetical protein [Kangiella sp. TOML190]